MADSLCARCHSRLRVGELVVDVREVSRANGHVATDRTEMLAHLTCPTPSGGTT